MPRQRGRPKEEDVYEIVELVHEKWRQDLSKQETKDKWGKSVKELAEMYARDFGSYKSAMESLSDACTRRLMGGKQHDRVGFINMLDAYLRGERNRIYDIMHNKDIQFKLGGITNKDDKENDLAHDLQKLAASNKNTDTSTQILARIGQGKFRDQVLDIWEGKCCVTAVEMRSVIRASHIKPWSNCSSYEKLDPHNGLPLIATLDALFDRGLISFNETGKMLASQFISKPDYEYLGLADARLNMPLAKASITYLSYHRNFIFLSE